MTRFHWPGEPVKCVGPVSNAFDGAWHYLRFALMTRALSIQSSLGNIRNR